MFTPALCRNLPKAAILMAAALALIGCIRADDPAPAAPQSPLAKKLVGTWVLVGTPDNIGKPPAAGGCLKFITGRHWTVTNSDAASGMVTANHGGTYTLDGDTYTETVEYATETLRDMIGHKYKYKVKVEGDIFTNIGDGNPYTEAWKRAK